MSYRPSTGQADRAKGFKKLRDGDEARKRRGDSVLNTRKDRRNEQIEKRRKAWDACAPGQSTEQEMRDETSGAEPPPSTLSISAAHVPLEGDGTTFQIVQWIKTIASRESGADVKLAATKSLRKLLSKRKDPPINQIIEAGAVPWVVLQLQDDSNPKLQVESAWVITNITSGSSEQTRMILEHGAAQVLTQ
jgi:hypothetical protein